MAITLPDPPLHMRQTLELARTLSGRPVLLLDLDEVVLEFVLPFARFAKSRGFGFELSRFLSPHNILDSLTGQPVAEDVAAALRQDFGEQQWEWQRPVHGMLDALLALRRTYDLVYLSASEDRFRAARTKLLQSLGCNDPLLLVPGEKQDVAALLATHVKVVGFVDDIPANLEKVQRSVPAAKCVHFAAHEPFRAVLAPLWQQGPAVASWPDIVSVFEMR